MLHNNNKPVVKVNKGGRPKLQKLYIVDGVKVWNETGIKKELRDGAIEHGTRIQEVVIRSTFKAVARMSMKKVKRN